MQEIKRILVAVDFSEPSVRAAEVAADIARCRGADLVLLVVIEHVDSPNARLAQIARRRYPDEDPALVVDEAARAELCQLGERLTAMTGSPVDCQVAFGDPADTIVAFARQGPFDLTSLGHTGHNRMVDLVLGSVAKKVIDTAQCPVLIVR